jgi:hypothetical protein
MKGRKFAKIDESSCHFNSGVFTLTKYLLSAHRAYENLERHGLKLEFLAAPLCPSRNSQLATYVIGGDRSFLRDRAFGFSLKRYKLGTVPYPGQSANEWRGRECSSAVRDPDRATFRTSTSGSFSFVAVTSEPEDF